MHYKKGRLFFSLVTLFGLYFSAISAQPGSVSPYSYFNIGDLQYNGFARQQGMGGVVTPFSGNSYINIDNPASLPLLQISTFEAAARAEYTWLSSGGEKGTNKTANLAYLTLGFPVIKNRWAASFGLVPLSTTGYDITDNGTVTIDNVPSAYNIIYQGSGGASRCFIANGFSPFFGSVERFRASGKYKQLAETKDTTQIRKIEKRRALAESFSLGINSSYIFGSLIKSRKIEFVNSTNILNSRVTDEISLSDFYFSYGLLFKKKLKNDFILSIGLAGANSSSINTTLNSVWTNYTLVGGATSTQDSVRTITDYNGETLIPAWFSGGFLIEKSSRWLVGADFSYQLWDQYKSSFAPNQSFVNSYRISAGGQYVPVENKIEYRFGLKYNKTFLDLNNTPVNEYSVSTGFGIPIRLKNSEKLSNYNKPILNFSIEAGQRGTESNGLIKEQYLRFYVGITINELWFIKRKYD